MPNHGTRAGMKGYGTACLVLLPMSILVPMLCVGMHIWGLVLVAGYRSLGTVSLLAPEDCELIVD